MAKKHGKTGIITLGSVAGITSWTLGKTSDMVDITAMGAITNKKFTPGPKTFTFGCEAISASPALSELWANASGIKSFDVSGTCEALEVSALGDTDTDDLPYKTFEAGLHEWEGTFEIDLDLNTLPPVVGASYSNAGFTGVVQSVDMTGEVAGLVSYSIGIKGTDALPASLSGDLGAKSFSVATGAAVGDYTASGDVIVTSYRIAGSLGAPITYSIESQGTGLLTEGTVTE